jgi:hypothetical protein
VPVAVTPSASCKRGFANAAAPLLVLLVLLLEVLFFAVSVVVSIVEVMIYKIVMDLKLDELNSL